MFAPIATIIPYDTLDQAVEIANGTRYGLGASVFGPDQEHCVKVAKRLQCGMVSINDFAVFYVRPSLPNLQTYDTHIFPAVEVRLPQFTVPEEESQLTLTRSQDLPFGGVKMSGYGRFGVCLSAFLT